MDGVYNGLLANEGPRAQGEQGRDLGFDGKTLIHPDRLATANAVFAPLAGNPAFAFAQRAALGAGEARGEGVAVLDGRIVENLQGAMARRPQARAAASVAQEAALLPQVDRQRGLAA